MLEIGVVAMFRFSRLIPQHAFWEVVKLRKWSYQTLDKAAEFESFVHLLGDEIRRRGLTKSESEILAEREPDCGRA